jgi:dihydroorotase
MKLLLKGGRVVDPRQNMDSVADVLVENGKIARIEKDITEEGARVIDVSNMLVVPGLIDMHVHLREPGFEYKETIETGSTSAVAGGFSSIACMANTNPVNDNKSVTDFIKRQANLADMANVYPVAALTMDQQGKVLTEFGDLKDSGAVALSDDGNPVMDSGLMRNALEYAHSLDIPVISHCEDSTLSAGGFMNEGFVSTELGLCGIPNIAEDVMVARDIAISAFTKAPVHIAHVSTSGSVGMIREAKRMGINVTAETAPHYFTLTDESLRGFSTDLKMYPPLRDAKDVEAVKEGLKDGTIDAIASDHAPHSSIEKNIEFEYAANGIIGMETSLPLCLKLVEEGILSINGLIEKMSANPSDILKIKKGTLRPGSDADITVVDMNKTWTVDKHKFLSKSRNCPFDGWTLKGKAVITVVNGKIKYENS